MAPHGADSNASGYLNTLLKATDRSRSTAVTVIAPLLRRGKPTESLEDLRATLRRIPADAAPKMIDAIISFTTTDVQALDASADLVELIAEALCALPACELRAVLLVANPAVADHCVEKLKHTRALLTKRLKEWLTEPLEVTRLLVGLKDPRLLEYARTQLLLPPLDGGAIAMSFVLVQRMAVFAAALEGRELANGQLSVADPDFTDILRR